MTTFILRTAEHIIRASDREHPADAMLRRELKSQRELSPRQTAEISRCIFSYYRWQGWLKETQPSARGIEQALELADRFAREPQSFQDAELIGRVVPDWLGKEMELTPAWARAMQTQPRLWLRARPGLGRQVAKGLGACSAFGQGRLADTLEYTGDQDLFLTREFHDGEFEIQDLSSQAVGFACAPHAGETWWDACAGEGGKLLHLSALMGNKGLIWASDRTDWRLQRLKRRAARAKVFNYRAAAWDGEAKLPTRTKFDGVLLDSPCTGVGTWHRNPHARWTACAQDVQELSELQKHLLKHVIPAVKPGGSLVYAVCTMTRRETVEIVEWFANEAPEFRPLPMANPLADKPGSAQLLFWPQEFGGNGMFIAAWRKAAEK